MDMRLKNRRNRDDATEPAAGAAQGPAILDDDIPF
jgi:hypothetical protein